jgi:hypothetical protein
MPMAYYYKIEERATEEVLNAKKLHGDDWWENVGITNLNWWLSKHPDDPAHEKIEALYAYMREGYRKCGLVK